MEYPFNEIDLTKLPMYERQYKAHKASAKQRGIEFDMSFVRWLTIWHESGYLLLRGRGAGRYVMARYGDQGGYTADNVDIVPSEVNLQQEQAVRRRIRAKRENVAQGRDSYAHLRRGKHPKGRRVVDPYGIVFPSAMAAAEAHGVTRQGVARNCRVEAGGWRYE